jgi:hypothetical protein
MAADCPATGSPFVLNLYRKERKDHKEKSGPKNVSFALKTQMNRPAASRAGPTFAFYALSAVDLAERPSSATGRSRH